ncbi:MAG: polysaccharide deacetylase family protein [Puia sp.]|nr:polysaccharide deacetylase family protein [Puia sp.]
MIWNYQRISLSCVSALFLFSFNAGPKITGITGPLLAGETSLHSLAPASHAILNPKKAIAPYTIYLTFDDGPCAGSEKVNELCQKDNLFINVFLIGKNVYRNENSRMLFHQYISNPLIETGNHSFTHAERHYRQYFRDPETVLSDFNRNRDSLLFSNNFARLPGRNFFRLDSLTRNDITNGSEAADTLAANGYHIFGWDIEWRSRPAKGISLHTGSEMIEIVQKMISKKKTFLPDRIVILLHDPELQDSAFRSALEDFIDKARADGNFRFDHLSNY